MPDRSTKIAETSFLSMSIVIALLGCAGWLTMVYANGLENTKEIAAIKVSREAGIQNNREFQQKIIDDIGTLKGQVQFLVDHTKKERK